MKYLQSVGLFSMLFHFSYSILHTLLSPTTEFIRSFGIMLPNIIIATPSSPNTS